jgi:hypothetical protein
LRASPGAASTSWSARASRRACARSCPVTSCVKASSCTVKRVGERCVGLSPAALPPQLAPNLTVPVDSTQPSRNGNPGAVECDKLARHYLKARWRDPGCAEDMACIQPFLNALLPMEAALCVESLRKLTKWKPGPAGRGGDRMLNKRAALSPGETRSVRRKINEEASDEEIDDDHLSMRSTVVTSQSPPHEPAGRRADVQTALCIEPAHLHGLGTWSPAMMMLWPGLAAVPAASAAKSEAPALLKGASLSAADILQRLAQQVATHQASLALVQPPLAPAYSLAAARNTVKAHVKSPAAQAPAHDQSMLPMLSASSTLAHMITTNAAPVSTILPPLRQVLLGTASEDGTGA